VGKFDYSSGQVPDSTKWQWVEVEQKITGKEIVQVKLSSRAVVKNKGWGCVYSQEKLHTNRIS